MKMKIVAFVAGALVLGLADARAQSASNTSTADHNAAAAIGGPGTDQSPGTVGAMNAVVSGIATSPDDVARQQAGHRTVAYGGQRLGGDVPGTAVMGQSPGTVGATPGY